MLKIIHVEKSKKKFIFTFQNIERLTFLEKLQTLFKKETKITEEFKIRCPLKAGLFDLPNMTYYPNNKNIEHKNYVVIEHQLRNWIAKPQNFLR